MPVGVACGRVAACVGPSAGGLAVLGMRRMREHCREGVRVADSRTGRVWVTGSVGPLPWARPGRRRRLDRTRPRRGRTLDEQRRAWPASGRGAAEKVKRWRGWDGIAGAALAFRSGESLVVTLLIGFGLTWVFRLSGLGSKIHRWIGAG